MPGLTTLLSGLGRNAIEQRALVLSSQQITCEIRRDQDGWSLLVELQDAERAADALRAYEVENRGRKVKPTPPPEYGTSWSGIGMAALLVAFHFAVTDPEAGGVFQRHGSASAQLILRGEWWRTVTALSLHVDLAHLFSNALSCALFATAVCRSAGPGVGAWGILLAGAIGNALTASYHGANHVSVGASTAIFGAVGLLVGKGLVSGRRLGLRGGRALAPIAAGLGLLAMLGTGGGRTDVLAHVLGLVSGTALGFCYARLRPVPPRKAAQLQLLAAAAGALVLCWVLALRQVF